ncbi:MAG: metallophosphoesterase, partial [Bacteroidia bacterium]
MLYLFMFLIGLSSNKLNAQSPNILLGRPSNTSITASIMFEQEADFYLEYGIESGVYSQNTSTIHAQPNSPIEVEIDNLQSNKKYYYHLKYKSLNNPNFLTSDEFSFHTQRSPESTFSFTIESDEHLYDKKGVRSLYEITLANQAADKPDFMLSLGDIFGDDHEPFTISSGALDSLHRDYRPFLGKICHSIPFYVCLGNHEGENDYYYNINPPNNLCIWGTQWRK